MRRMFWLGCFFALYPAAYAGAQTINERVDAVIRVCTMGADQRLEISLRALLLRRFAGGADVSGALISRPQILELLRQLGLSEQSKQFLIEKLYTCIDSSRSFMFGQPVPVTQSSPRVTQEPPSSLPFQVLITSPRDTVCARTEVKGKITRDIATDARGKLWIVIHPHETNDFWVQTPVSVDGNNQWRTFPYFGRPKLDIGKPFEFKAFVNPISPIAAEQRLKDWPNASWSSDVVQVIRANC
jgi:hypothetical protein